jgi:hypothetical protein
MTTPEDGATIVEAAPLEGLTPSPGQADSSDQDGGGDSAPDGLQTRITELEASNAKLNSDLKAREGRDRKAETQERSLAALGDRVDGLLESNSALFGSLSTQISSGDATGLTDTIKDLKTTAQSQRAAMTFDTAYEGLTDRMSGLVDDAPEETERWNTEIRKQNETRVEERNLGELYAIHADAVTTAARKQREALEADNTELKNKQGDIRRQVEEEMDVHDLGGGSSAASAGETITAENIDNLMGRISEFDTKKQTEIRDKYRTLILTGSFT